MTCSQVLAYERSYRQFRCRWPFAVWRSGATARPARQAGACARRPRWAGGAPLRHQHPVFILVAGLYMTFASWSFQTGWVAVALVSLLLIAPIAGVIVESRRRVIAKLATEAHDGPLPETLLARIHDPVLVTTPRTVTALLLGIVFLMTNKPSLPVALLVMAIALVLGLASGLLVSGTSRTVDQGMAGDATRVAHE
ncbi:MAG: DUF2269 family protein [Ktedonobacterales bacterium]